MELWRELPPAYREKVLDAALRQYRHPRDMLGPLEDDMSVRALLERILRTVLVVPLKTE